MRPVLKPLDRQTLVVTGATSGIGLATARAAAARGAAVLLVARDEADLNRVAAELRAAGGRAEVVVGDVGDPATASKVVETAIDRFGGFDTWVNDAGAGIYGDLATLDVDEHRRLFETNYWGVVYGSQAALAHLRARGGGALINIGSVLSDMPTAVQGAYAASKHAVKGYTNCLRIEALRDATPVSITLIKPSAIGTPFPQNARNDTTGRASLPPPIYAPEVVADAILHAAANVTREITVGGGGFVQVMLATHAAALFERLAGAITPKLSIPDEADDSVDGLTRPGVGGRTVGEDKGRAFSVFTSLQTHPRLVASVGFGLAIGVAAAVAWRARPDGVELPDYPADEIRTLRRRLARSGRQFGAQAADALSAAPDLGRKAAGTLTRAGSRVRDFMPD